MVRRASYIGYRRAYILAINRYKSTNTSAAAGTNAQIMPEEPIYRLYMGDLIGLEHAALEAAYTSSIRP